MTIFLTSLGNDPQTIQTLDKYIHGIAGKSIAYIPTAANAEGWHSWENGRTIPILKEQGAIISIVELEEYINQNIYDALKNKDIIWFGGGMAGYLLYWIRRVSLDIYLPRLLEKCVYVGSSAGSMIAGLSLDLAAWYPEDPERGAEVFQTLHLVDFDIFPHYEDSKYDIIKKNYTGKKLYLLKDGEEILVEDGNVLVIGEERII